jgi:hypothetical protein
MFPEGSRVLKYFNSDSVQLRGKIIAFQGTIEDAQVLLRGLRAGSGGISSSRAWRKLHICANVQREYCFCSSI